MWLFRPLLLIVALLLLGACGFQPLHAKRGGRAAAADLATIYVNRIQDRAGQQLRNHLLDILTPRGSPREPRYYLSVNLTESIQELAVRKDSFATRANFQLSATYQLTDAKSKRSLLVSGSRVVSGYNISQSEFATLIAEKDARSKAVQQISEDIRSRLGVYFFDRAAAPAKPVK